MMKSYLVLIGIGFLLFLTACGGGSDQSETASAGEQAGAEKKEKKQEKPKEEKPPEPPAQVYTWEQIRKDTLDERTKIAVEGYFGSLSSYMSKSGGRYELDFFRRRNQQTGYRLEAKIKVGNYLNGVRELKSGFNDKSLQVIAHDTTTLGVGSYARLEGYLRKSSTHESLKKEDYFTVTKVIALPDSFDKALFKSARKLTTQLMKKTDLPELYTYMDVRFKFPKKVMSKKGNYLLDVKQSFNSYFKRVRVKIGIGPSMVQEFPTLFDKDSFVIRDYKGEKHSGTKGSYRLYGLLRDETGDYVMEEKEWSFTVEEIVKR